MSIDLMSMVWRVTWPTQSQLLVALKLADHAHDDGSHVHPGKTSVSKQAQCSESTVANALRAFRDCGLLHVVRKGGKGPKDPTVYAFNVPLLKTLADARAELKGTADTLEIPEEFYPQGVNEEGSTIDHLGNGRGQSDPSKGSTDTSKGSKLLTPNHHLEPSNRTISAHARAKGEFPDLKNGSEPKPVRPAIDLTPADASWQDWISHIEARGHEALAQRAREAGRMQVPARWPERAPPDALPNVPKPPKSFTDRMLGETAA